MRCVRLFALVLSLLLCSVSASAEWMENGTPIATLGVGEYVPRIVSNGAGEAIVAWYDDNADIFVQRLDAYGKMLWTDGGVAICTASGMRWDAQIISDGAGGAIVAWKDYRNSNYDIYAQRVNANGAALWTANGIPVCSQSASQRNQKITSDGAGGAIIAWQDDRNGDYDVYAQRINASGAAQWTANGVFLCVVPWEQMDIQLLPRSAGGAFVAWSDMRNGYSIDIYYQVVYANGTTAYGAPGNALTSTSANEGSARLATDGLGGAIVAWADWSTGYGNIYAQRINQDGSMLWTPGGVPVCAATGNQVGARIVSDAAHGAIVGWSDYRNSSMVNDFYTQRVNSSGAAQWATNGVPVVQSGSGVDVPELVSDGKGGGILSWTDSRFGDPDIFCQRIDPYGGTYWASGGAEVCVMNGYQYGPSLICDGEAGAFLAWYDSRSGSNTDIYAQRMERSGYWGYPSPVIADIRDVPGDQGSFVDLAWDASRLDDWYFQLINYYTIWRAIGHPAALAMAADGAALIDDPSKFDPASKAPVIRIEQIGATTYYWKLVSTVFAYYLDGYSEPVATLFDSTAASTEYHYFQVIAHGNYQGQFWASPPDSGYSVDNLAPAPPVGLTGEQEYSPAGLTLVWDPNTEIDLGGYAIYRGLSPDFVPSEANRVAAPADTLWFDGDWQWSDGFYYKVSALDIHGNESGFALLAPDNVTAVETPKTPGAAYLRQNYPNPFNPTTTIAFSIATDSEVELAIYDVTGARVRTLVREHRRANNYRELWDGTSDSGDTVASGVYFYQLMAQNFSQTKKMVLLK